VMADTAVEISEAYGSHGNIIYADLDVQYVETRNIVMDETILVYDTVN